jgi:hypothetical protein
MLLDSETVRLFVWPYYVALLIWGVYGTFFAAPSVLVEPVMGHLAYNLWIWMNIGGTSFVLIGLILRHGGKPIAEMNTPQLFTDYLGLWMQFGGHVCMGLVLFTYEYAGIVGAYWGQAAFTLFIIPPYVGGCMLLSLQTARKLWHAEKLHRLTNGAP